MSQQFTIFTANDETSVPVLAKDNHLFISNEALVENFGRQLEPEGLCRDEVCISVRNRDDDDRRADSDDATGTLRGINSMGPQFMKMVRDWSKQGHDYYEPLDW